jgi:type IV pilus assembly protein PilX
MKTATASRLPRRERGIVLIAALAVLLMLTLLSVGMFRSFGLEERITGNTREKQHAFFAAQSALQNAENWLVSGNAGSGVPCTVQVSATPVICTTPAPVTQQQLATTIWNTSFGTTFTPPSLTLNGTSTTQMASSYYASPQFAIFSLGPDPTGQGSLFQVTAQGFGGSNTNSVAVVQSVYSVNSGTQQVNR